MGGAAITPAIERLGPWADLAACAGLDPELFFPARGDHRTEVNARAVCAECQVRAECLEYAMVNTERYGIWGGMSERQRRRIRHASAVRRAA